MKKGILICLLVVCFVAVIMGIIFRVILRDFSVEFEVVERIASPDGSYTAVAFLADGGATTSTSPQVSIVFGKDDFRKQTNKVFIGDRSDFIDIEWIDRKKLVIKHRVCEEDIFLQVIKKNKIDIAYVSVED